MNMRRVFVCGVIGVSALANASPAVFYAGDVANVGGCRAQVNYPIGFDSRLYDNFTLGQATNIDGLSASFSINGTNATSVSWEIRSGVQAGSGGTLLYSGTNACTNTYENTWSTYKYVASIPTITLGPGDYYLSISANGGSDWIYVAGTLGDNAVGGPIADGKSIWNCPQFGFNWLPVEVVNNGNSFNCAYGLTGTAVVPEPSSILTLSLGVLAFRRRRRKLTASWLD